MLALMPQVGPGFWLLAGVGAPSHVYHAPSISSPVQSGAGGMAGAVWLEERLSSLLILWRSTHAESGLCGCGGSVSSRSVCLLDGRVLVFPGYSPTF